MTVFIDYGFYSAINDSLLLLGFTKQRMFVRSCVQTDTFVAERGAPPHWAQRGC